MHLPHLPYLPPEIWDMIYRHLHKIYMRELKKEIIYNVAWVRVNTKEGYQYSFWVGGGNYYKALEVEWD